MPYAQEGIKPYGGKESKRVQVQKMFNSIAHSYDKLNHTLSLGVDKWWRQCAVDYLKKCGQRPETILDVATGTGDFAILAQCELKAKKVIGCDISEEMMNIGKRKVKSAGLDDSIQFKYEDCSQMSFADNQFDAVITAFGLRNFENLDQCMREMRRVIKPGGHLVAIDLCTPVSFPMKQLFWVYKKAVMPLVGRLVSHDQNAYTYLPHTMDAVPQARAMQAIIEKAGFREARYKRLTFGMCILYTAVK